MYEAWQTCETIIAFPVLRQAAPPLPNSLIRIVRGGVSRDTLPSLAASAAGRAGKKIPVGYAVGVRVAAEQHTLKPDDVEFRS